MSWDILLQRFPEETARPEEVPDDYLSPSVGSRADVASAVCKLFRSVESAGESFITIARSAFTMEISLGDEEQCSQLLLHVHVNGDASSATKSILRLADHFGMRAVDCSSGAFIEPVRNRRRREVSDKEREDEARYRRNLEECAKNPVPRPEWPLSGLEHGPCDRYIYLSLLPDESPKQQQKAVYQHWLELFKEHGKLLPTIMGPAFVLTLPDGDVFGDFCVARHPGLVTETVAEMIPRVKKGAALVRAFATATRRRSGEIEDGSVFVCDNGQRIPLAECVYRKLWTDADYSRKVKPKEKRRRNP